MTMQSSQRSRINPFQAMEAFRDAQSLIEQGEEVVHLSLGQPGAKAPQAVINAVAEAMKAESLGYTDACGMVALRQALAEHYKAQYGAQVDPSRIFITVGSSAAYFLSLLCAFEAGDKVALVTPYYPASPNMMRALGIEPIIMRARADDNYQPTLAMLKALEHKPDGLIIASPSNPTGTVIDPQELQEITHYCEANDIRIMSDEIYHGVTYGQVQTPSMVQLSDQMIVTNSFSKYYLLPGWRLGWCVMPQSLVRSMESLLQNFFISPPAVSQLAALEVLKHRDALDEVVKGYEHNRHILINGLRTAGIERIADAQGAFYLYADVSAFTDDSQLFCKEMLEEAGVCAVPGIDFDEEEGHRFVRFSYSGDGASIQSASERLSRWMQIKRKAA